MRKQILILATATVIALLLASCGSDTVGNQTAQQEDLVEAPVQEVQASGGFDNAVKTPAGVSYTLSSPSKFVPGKFAAGQLLDQSYQGFKVSITNNSSADLDLATLIVKGVTSSGECVDIFDGDNSFNGAPQEGLAKGATITFGWALSCPGKSGDELKVNLSNAEVSIVEIVGKLS